MMEHVYVANNGEHLRLTNAFVTAAEQEGKLTQDHSTSTEHVTYWKIPENR